MNKTKTVEEINPAIEKLLRNYKGFKQLEDTSSYKRYLLPLGVSDNVEVLAWKEFTREVIFRHDNFLGQRRFFNTNIPYTSIDDLESDFKRMGLKIPERLQKLSNGKTIKTKD